MLDAMQCMMERSREDDEYGEQRRHGERRSGPDQVGPTDKGRRYRVILYHVRTDDADGRYRGGTWTLDWPPADREGPAGLCSNECGGCSGVPQRERGDPTEERYKPRNVPPAIQERAQE